MLVLKKDNSLINFDPNRIITAINKSSDRVGVKLTLDVLNIIAQNVEKQCYDKIPVSEIHKLVEVELENHNPQIAKSYREYRNYKGDFARIMDSVLTYKNDIEFRGERENANADSSFVSTKRSLTYKELNKEWYKKFFLRQEELTAIREGYIYIHDMGDRLDTINCSLFDMKTVLKGGFELANMKYTEPKYLTTAFDVISDIALASAAQQYGGYTIPEVDKILLPYVEKSYKKHFNEARELLNGFSTKYLVDKRAREVALKKVTKELEQGFQAWEYKFNTLASSRGDYPFIVITFGLETSEFGKMINKACLKIRQGGQGEEHKKKVVLFPKLVFLYDENVHGKNKPAYDVFKAAIECSSKAMYPDYLSMNHGYTGEMYQKYGEVVSPMGKGNYSPSKIY